MNLNAYISIPHAVMLELNTKLDKERCTLKAANKWLGETHNIHIKDKSFARKVHNWREDNGYPVYGRQKNGHLLTDEQKAAKALEVAEQAALREWKRTHREERKEPVFAPFEDCAEAERDRGRHWL